MSTPIRPPLVLRNVDAQAPSKLLSRPPRVVPQQASRSTTLPQQEVVPIPDAAPAAARNQRDGYEAGMREGLKDAERQVAEHLQAQVAKLEAQAKAHIDKLTQEHEQRLERLDALLQGLEASVTERLDELEPAAAALAFDAVCKLLGSKAQQADILAALVAQGMRQLRSGTLLSIRLHPADLALLADHPTREDLTQRHPAVQWETDARSPRGTCRLATDRGSLDASLLTQLEHLRDLWSDGASA